MIGKVYYLVLYLFNDMMLYYCFVYDMDMCSVIDIYVVVQEYVDQFLLMILFMCLIILVGMYEWKDGWMEKMIICDLNIFCYYVY